MSRIKKIVLMIIICLACISIHNVSLAATTSWKNTRSFSLSKGSCSNKKHTGCTTYSTGRITMHIGADGFLSGSAKPYIDKDVGLICLQHDTEAETFLENGESGMEIQYKMTISNKSVTIIPMSEAAKSASGSSTMSTTSKGAAKVAYILSHISNSAGESERKNNGAQGALWKVIKPFLEDLKDKTSFNGIVVSQYQGKWDDVANAVKYYNEANAYANTSIFSPSTVKTKITVSELDNNYYIIGPFKMKFANGSYENNGNVTQFAGFNSANLKMDNSQLDSKNWTLCNKEGKGMSEPTSNKNFYIKVKKAKIGAKGILTIKTRKMNVYADFYTMTSKKGRQDQAIVTEAGRYYDNEEVTFEFDTFGNLRIAKKDADSGNALSGIGFTIRNSNGQYIQALDTNKKVQASATGIIKNIQFTKNASETTTFSTNEQGIIELHNIPVDTYTVEEVSVGEHYAYALNGNNITWEANGKTNTGQSAKVLIKGQPPTIANSTNTMLSDEYVTIATVKNKKQVGELNLIKVDDRNRNKILPKVEFVIRSSEFNNQYIKVKATGSNVTNNTDGWATRIVGSSRINDTKDTKNNPTLEYVEEMSKATVFVTDGNGIIDIQNLISSIDGTTMIEYKLEEIKNPNYGYLSGSSGEYVNYKVTYEGESTTSNGTVKLTTSDVISVTATNHQEYIRLAGFVWEDIVHGKDNTVNNKYDETEALVEGIQVKLYKEGTFIAETTTNSNGEYQFGAENKDYYYNTDYVKDGKETGNLRIDDLSQYYVEFEYDGLKYTSVVVDKDYSSSDYKITSKAEEKHADREIVNNKFAIISHNQASNTENTGTYKLEYEFGDNVSTYKDDTYWKYIRDTDNKKLHVDKVKEENYEVLASTQESGFDLKYAWEAQFQNSGSEILTGINLGIEKRAQADLALSSDLNTVDISINTGSGVYMNTYTYAKRKIEEDTNDFGIETKFGNSTGSYSNRNLNLYTRRIYESDLAYNEKNPGLMEIYVTYKIRVKNQSTKLISRVNEIANYYDNRYTIVESWRGDNKEDIVEWNNESKYNPIKEMDKQYNVGYTNSLAEIEIAPSGYIDIYIKFKLDNEKGVRALIKNQTTLNNVAEITSFSTVESGKPYAAIDEDSNPGSAEIKLIGDTRPTETTLHGRTYYIENNKLDTTTYEDDTDMAPSLVLGIEDANPTRGLSGTVFEDEDAKHNNDDTHPGEERIGDGILRTDDKNRIEKAKVELLDKDGNVAKLHKLSIENGIVSTKEENAITETNNKGEYELTGVIPGRYLIRYTYGKDTWIVDESGNRIEEINVRDYKSTIITSNLIKNALNLGKNPERMGDLNWILTYEDDKGQTKSKSKDAEGLIRYSDATDDISKRNKMDDLYYGTYGDNSQITSDTAFFDVGVEYSEVKEKEGFNGRVSFTDYKDEYELPEGTVLALKDGRIVLLPTFYAVNPYQDFGIIERPRQEYDVNKRVSNLKVTLANGQILINGNPYKQFVEGETDWKNIEASSDNHLPYVKALPSHVAAEIDNEIIQSAKLNIEYTISIKNNSELDYDYIEDQNYYYYGNNGTKQIKVAIKKVVDYMENGLVYDEEKNEDWTKVTPNELLSYTKDGGDHKQLIANNVYDDIKQGYTISITKAFYDNGIEVGKVASTKIYGSKVLSSSEKGINVENHAEIIETMGIRTIKNSIPGNYNPKEGKPDEPDDDMTLLTITGPTGLTDNKTYVILITATALLVLAGGVYIIKKKVI